MISSVYRAWVLLRRGDAEAAGREVAELLPRSREIGYGEFLAPALVISAEVALELGDPAAALALVTEFARGARTNPEFWRIFLPLAARVVVALGALDVADELMSLAGKEFPRRMELSIESTTAILEEARGEASAAADRYRAAAEGWAAYGFGLEEARTRTGLGRCLFALGRPDEACAELVKAREIIEPLGARPMLAEVDHLLAGAGATAG
jgi:tetratricopeptide (TPR) repeat protein